MRVVRFCLSSWLVGMVGVTAMAATDSSPVTFNKNVLPILQKNCQGCTDPAK